MTVFLKIVVVVATAAVAFFVCFFSSSSFFFGGGSVLRDRQTVRDRETHTQRTLMAIVVNGWFVDLLVECVGG